MDVQIDTCRRAIRAAGGNVGHAVVYADEAKTGRVLGGREALARLVGDTGAGKLDRVWVYKWDRLGRSLADSANIVRDLERTGIEIASATEGHDPLTRGVLLAVAESYSVVLSQRTKAGLRRRFEEHAFTGHVVPFGYHLVNGDGKRKHMQVEPAEAKIVRFIFDAYLAGKGTKAITKRLNERGVRSRKRGTWTYTTVRNMLNNEVYVGKVYFGRWDCWVDPDTGRKRQKLKPRNEWSMYQDESLRIISDEQFQAVQDRVAERARPDLRHRTRAARQAFTGLVFCGECGSLFYRRVYKDRKGVKRWPYLYCGERHRNRASTHCNCHIRVREDKLLAKIVGALMPILTASEDLVEQAVAAARERASTNKEDAERIRAEIAAIEREAEKLIECLLDEGLNESTKRSVNRRSAKLDQRRQELEAALESLADAANDNTQELAGAVQQALEEARQTLASVASPEQLNNLLRELIGEFVVYPDGTIGPKGECVVSGNLEGPSYATRRIREVLWDKFRQVA